MRILTGLAVAASILSCASIAAAQDFSLEPNYGTVTLETGFTPDPHTVSLTAGGGIDASTSSVLAAYSCRGFITAAPDYRVNYTAGTTYPLTFKVVSEADTTLVINAADGSWYCVDDVDGFNPVITLPTPSSGQYDIWVGTYGEATAAATLQVTEL